MDLIETLQNKMKNLDEVIMWIIGMSKSWFYL